MGSGGKACARLFMNPLRCGRAAPDLSAAVSIGSCMSNASVTSRRCVCTDRPYMRNEPLFFGHARKKVVCRAAGRWVSGGPGVTGTQSVCVRTGQAHTGLTVLEKQVSGKKRLLEPRAAL